MHRRLHLVWIAWIGACAIGGFVGCRLSSARAPSLVWIAFAVLSGCWTVAIGALIRRRVSPVIAWIIERTLFIVMYMLLFAGLVVFSVSNLVTDRFAALLWAASAGAVLGLASGLLIRPYLAPQGQRRWLVANISCGILTLLFAVITIHPIPTLVPDLQSSLVVGLIISAGWGIVPGALLESLLQTVPLPIAESIQQRLARAATARQRWINGIVIMISLLAGSLSIYWGRCELVTCQPATWAEMLDLAQTQASKAGSDYRIGMIRADPAFRSEPTPDGPYDITINIELISSQPDMTHDGMSPAQTIEFADRDQRVHWQQRGWRSDVPSVETQQRLRRIRIAPRDVYRLTWDTAHRELSSSIRVSAPSTYLYTEGWPQERFGVESIWVISYYDDTDYLTYWIDAQTGKVVSQSKERIP